MRSPHRHLPVVPALLLLWAVLPVVLVGCSSEEEIEPSIIFMTGDDASSGQAGDDVGAGGEDGVLPPVCPAESVRCHDNAVWSCFENQWSVAVDCGELACVDGACVCLPECGTKICGSDGCGGLCGTCDVGSTCNETTGTCTAGPEAQVFTAVYVEDIWGGSCSGFSSSGSDIRGAALFDPDGELVGYWEEVVGDPGTEGCQNSYTDAAVVLGEPTGAQLALQGGWVIGTFEGKNAIGPGWSFSVYEYDGSMGGSSETYAVWLATDLDCVETNDPKHDCMVPVSEDGYGTTTFKVGE